MRRGAPDYVSDQSYTVHSSIPLRYRTTSPAIRFSFVAAGLKERGRNPLLRTPWPPTGIHRSIRYNKTTILAPTRDDSIGLGRRQTGPFSQNHARLSFEAGCTSHGRDVVDALHAPFPLRPLHLGQFHHGNGGTSDRRKGEKEAKEGERRKGQTHTSPLTSYILHNITVVCPRGKIELARNGSGISSTASTPIFFEFIDTIGMIPGALVFARSPR